MIAVDTNILVRLLTKDDPQQARRASRAMQADSILIPKTVILETEWVLRHAYGIERDAIVDGLQKLLGLPNATAEDQQAVFQAISWYGSGMDLADAMHLASSVKADRFVTFDRDLVRRSKKLAPIEVALP